MGHASSSWRDGRFLHKLLHVCTCSPLGHHPGCQALTASSIAWATASGRSRCRPWPHFSSMTSLQNQRQIQQGVSIPQEVFLPAWHRSGQSSLAVWERMISANVLLTPKDNSTWWPILLMSMYMESDPQNKVILQT